MRRLALVFALFLAISAHAAPAITDLIPNAGPSYWTTYVGLYGRDLYPQYATCEGVNAVSPCPATVFFGTRQAKVHYVSQTSISVEVTPQPAGSVDVRVTIQGQPEITIANGFRFYAANEGNPNDYTKYLVPLTTREVNGQFGSIWKVDLSMQSNYAQLVHGPVCNPVLPVICPGLILTPEKTHSVQVYPRGDGGDGAFIYIPKNTRPAMNSRVRDLSKNAQSWGTEIPLVKTEDFGYEFDLLDVPTDPRYRTTLRIYGEAMSGSTVAVTIYPRDGGAALERREISVSGVDVQGGDPILFPHHPAFVQLDPISVAARASGERVRIHVEVPGYQIVSPPPPRIWTFASITNNDTQQATTVTPSR